MSLKILTLLNGLAGIGGIATVPSTQMVASSRNLDLFQIANKSEYKVNNNNKRANEEVKNLSANNGLYASDEYGINPFPIGFTQILSPGLSFKIPLDLMWDHAKNLWSQSKDSNWTSWGYSAAALLAKGTGSNGVVQVDGQLTLSPLALAPLVADLNLVAHGSIFTGTLSNKMISVGGNIVTETHYSSKTVGDIVLVLSNPVPPEALGVVMAFVGTIETSDFHY